MRQFAELNAMSKKMIEKNAYLLLNANGKSIPTERRWFNHKSNYTKKIRLRIIRDNVQEYRSSIVIKPMFSFELIENFQKTWWRSI